MYRMHIARISSRVLVSAPPPKQSFLLFCWPAREMSALPRPCRLALRVTAKQLLAAPILAQHDITRFLVSRIPRGSVRFFLAEFLEARIISERIEHRIEPEQRGSERDRNESARVRHREQFLQSGDGTVGFPRLRRHPGEDLNRSGTVYRIFLDRICGHGLLRQSQRCGFVTETHIGQRETADKGITFWLFFAERFQFAARLSPTFLGGGVVAGDFLRPG